MINSGDHRPTTRKIMEKYMRLKRDFFERDTKILAKELLGKKIILEDKDEKLSAIIVETEAYINKDDDAAHFNKGLTNRTRIIDEVGGHLYIYTIYGMYLCFNIVGEKKGTHGAVLIRAVEPIEGIETMLKNRYKKTFTNPSKKDIINLTNGPGKFSMAFGISKDEYYGLDLSTSHKIWIEEGTSIKEEDIITSKRINIDYAVKGKDYLLRFYLKDNPFVSKK